MTHQLARTLHEIAYYPEHEPRATDPQHGVFASSRHHLIDVLGVGCWIGGATKTALHQGLPAGHRCFGAKQLEAHHHIAELSALNEEDWQAIAADFPTLGIHSDDDMKKAANAEGGLLILCDVHHRHPQMGIHAITEPIWKLNRYAKSDWSFTPTIEHPAT